MSEDDLNQNLEKDASGSASAGSLGEVADGRTKKPVDPSKYFDERARPGVYDPLEDELTGNKNNNEPSDPSAAGKASIDKPMIEFYSPNELRDFTIPEGVKLIGDYHLERGNITVLGGPPGVGKSRAITALAVAGATGKDWFGMNVHHPFKTMILQAENGRVRLKNEFADLDCDSLNERILISSPPSFGFAFLDNRFIKQLSEAVSKFEPDVFVIDPWNQLTRDITERDYMDAFEQISKVLPKDENSPAIVIVHHTRKPRFGEKANGRSLLNILSGSYVLTSVPRTVFVMQPASDSPEDKRIVWTCCKNNNGEMGERSVWEIGKGLCERIDEFDWEDFDKGEGRKPAQKVTLDHLKQLFQNGNVWLKKSDAAPKLQAIAGIGRTAAYEALNPKNRFGEYLRCRDDGSIGLLSPGD